MHYAALLGREHFVSKLIDAGADPCYTIKGIAVLDVVGYTPNKTTFRGFYKQNNYEQENDEFDLLLGKINTGFTKFVNKNTTQPFLDNIRHILRQAIEKKYPNDKKCSKNA